MRYFPRRAPRKMDISLLLKVCPNCLGDLVHRSDFTGDYYRCLQCNGRTVMGAQTDHLTGVRSVIESNPGRVRPPTLLPPNITIP